MLATFNLRSYLDRGKGMTLVEVMVGMTVLAIASLGILSLTTFLQQHSITSLSRQAAVTSSLGVLEYLVFEAPEVETVADSSGGSLQQVTVALANEGEVVLTLGEWSFTSFDLFGTPELAGDDLPVEMLVEIADERNSADKKTLRVDVSYRWPRRLPGQGIPTDRSLWLSGEISLTRSSL